MNQPIRLPPGQQLVAADKWPLVGERTPQKSDSPWTVSIGGLVGQPQIFSLDTLRTLPQTEQTVDIHCVTRWSKLQVGFGGVRLADLLSAAKPSTKARYISFVARSARHHSTSLPLSDAIEQQTLVALRCDGQPLAEMHGGPVRIVVPGRYFYKSVKWLTAIELLADDRLGYWEREAGYHNAADPWLEQRYIASELTKQQIATMLHSRDWSNRELRGIEADGLDLAGLVARGALLRNASFRRCNLRGANFEQANLSNAHFDQAVLSGASFINADCEGASFAGADLRGANFSGASLFGASFYDELQQGATSHEVETGSNVFEPAKFDAATRIDTAAIEQLTPPQQAFLGRHR